MSLSSLSFYFNSKKYPRSRWEDFHSTAIWLAKSSAVKLFNLMLFDKSQPKSLKTFAKFFRKSLSGTFFVELVLLHCVTLKWKTWNLGFHTHTIPSVFFWVRVLQELKVLIGLAIFRRQCQNDTWFSALLRSQIQLLSCQGVRQACWSFLLRVH